MPVADIRDQFQARVRAVPSSITGELASWLRTLADAVNKMATVSSFSTTNPNSYITALPGEIGQNVTSQITAHAWVKEIGSGKTGWSSLATQGGTWTGAVTSTTTVSGSYLSSGATVTGSWLSSIGTVQGTPLLGGNVILGTAGNELKIKTGTNASMGRSTLISGTTDVSNTLVTANSNLYLSVQVASGTLGGLAITGRNAASGFTIGSTSALDASTIAWLIVEPA